MTLSPDRSRNEPLLQLVLVFVAVVAAMAVNYRAAVLAVVVAGVCWPPAAPWLPLRPGFVLGRYLPFAVAWLAATIGYLHLAHACGHSIRPQPQLVELGQHGAAHPQFWTLVFGIVVVAPVCEELFFRGYLFTAVRGVASSRVAQLLTAAAFGLVHGVDYALPIAGLGLCFGWLRERTGALLPSMLAHAVHNGLTLALTVCWPTHLQWMYPQ
ncbi:MAG: CPBP family intramembrane metalloprotease [Planctomycetes bacterium]|nr:CPBP family intramembrane metalloprotease [Planctomycetota bacterium]